MVNLKFGIPDSQLKDKITDVDINCTDEIQAMAISVGCILAGKEPLVYMQNSGLGRIGDIVTSLYHPYKIPLPKMILSIRHLPFHHYYMGEITYQLLNLYQYDLDKIEIIEQEKL